MSKEQKVKELKKIVMGLSKSKTKIQESTNLIYDLGFDSVLMIELFTEVEDRFNLEFDFEDVDFEDIAIYQNFEEYVLRIAGF